MPVLVWILIAVLGIGAGTAVVVPAVTGAASKDEVKTAPAEPGTVKSDITKPIEPSRDQDQVVPEETTPAVVEQDEQPTEEPLPEKLPYADDPLLPVKAPADTTRTGGIAHKLPL